MIDQREFFDRLAGTWDDKKAEDIDARLDRVVAMSQVRPEMRILDVGTGTGAIIPALLKAMGNRGSIVAVDISERMLDAAKGKGFPDIVSFVRADFEELELPEQSFYRVICNAVLPHFTDKNRALAKAFALLRPDGLIVVAHPIGRDAVNKIHRESDSVVTEDRVPDAEAMKAMLEQAGFAEVSFVDESDFYLASGRRVS
jgi:ubiquinone/menaquinone biosynthesis C-methylase UbiE